MIFFFDIFRIKSKILVMLGLEIIEEKLIEIRNKKVLLDCDVAHLYGIETKRVNEAVKNNPEKFPEGYVIYLVIISEHFSALNFMVFATELKLLIFKISARTFLKNFSFRKE